MSDFINSVDILGDEAVTVSLIDATITEFSDDVITKVGGHGFRGCSKLKTLNLPKVTSVPGNFITDCASLTELHLPGLTSIGMNAFSYRLCPNKRLTFPSLTSIGNYGIPGLDYLELFDCGGNADSLWIGSSQNFQNCTRLKAFIARYNNVVSLAGKVFGNTPIGKGTGYIYVPIALIDSYKSATNWSTYASQFRALEDYTVDGTTTGAFDETKI